MNQEIPKSVQGIFRLLNQLPPPATGLTPSSMGLCASCGKLKHMTDFIFYDSGVIKNVTEQLCHQCVSSFTDCSKIVCCTCRVVIGWADPHKDKDGFVFEKTHSYHIKTCPNCEPGILKSDLIEKIIYLQRKQKNQL
jgi:hypothetical protein